MMKPMLRKGAKELIGWHEGLTGSPSPDLHGDISGLYGDISRLRGDISPALRGDISDLHGDISGLYGDISGLYGNISPDLHGNISDLRGNISGLRGYCTGISGDMDKCDLTEEDRVVGVRISSLVAGHKKGGR